MSRTIDVCSASGLFQFHAERVVENTPAGLGEYDTRFDIRVKYFATDRPERKFLNQCSEDWKIALAVDSRIAILQHTSGNTDHGPTNGIENLPAAAQETGVCFHGFQAVKDGEYSSCKIWFAQHKSGNSIAQGSDFSPSKSSPRFCIREISYRKIWDAGRLLYAVREIDHNVLAEEFPVMSGVWRFLWRTMMTYRYFNSVGKTHVIRSELPENCSESFVECLGETDFITDTKLPGHLPLGMLFRCTPTMRNIFRFEARSNAAHLAARQSMLCGNIGKMGTAEILLLDSEGHVVTFLPQLKDKATATVALLPIYCERSFEDVMKKWFSSLENRRPHGAHWRKQRNQAAAWHDTYLENTICNGEGYCLQNVKACSSGSQDGRIFEKFEQPSANRNSTPTFVPKTQIQTKFRRCCADSDPLSQKTFGDMLRTHFRWLQQPQMPRSLSGQRALKANPLPENQRTARVLDPNPYLHGVAFCGTFGFQDAAPDDCMVLHWKQVQRDYRVWLQPNRSDRRWIENLIKKLWQVAWDRWSLQEQGESA